MSTRPQICLAAFALVAGCGSDPTEPDPEPSFRTEIRLWSDPGDYIGQGETYSYDQADAFITATATGVTLTVDVKGYEYWTGTFAVPETLDRLEPGTYGDLARYPFHDRSKGGLAWFGEGRACNELTGSFMIDSVTYSNSALARIGLTFEQRCESGTDALTAEIVWAASDTIEPPGPVAPPPTSLWQPPAGAVPAAGTFAYLESDPDDYIGQGQTNLFTPDDAVITASTFGSGLRLEIEAAELWVGEFEPMYTIDRLEPGYYPDIRRGPSANPAKGSLDCSAGTRGCNKVVGWYVVDSVAFTNDVIQAVELRFEQLCEGLAHNRLRGAVRWER